MEEWTDEELVQKAKKGDEDSFMELAKRYQERIYKLVLGMTGSHLDADDLSQETFLQAYRSMRNFREKSSFHTWLHRIAVNLTYNFFKKTKHERQRQEIALESVLIDPEGPSFGMSPEKLSVQKEFRIKLREAIDSLPWIYRVSFILVAFQGLSHKQASEILNCSENTVSWRMHKARKALQERLRAYLG